MGIHGCLGSVTLYWALADKNEIENSNFINFQFVFLFFFFNFLSKLLMLVWLMNQTHEWRGKTDEKRKKCN